MSLYGDLPQVKNSSEVAGGAPAGWPAVVMAPPSLKKPAVPALKAPPSVLRAAAAGGVSGPGTQLTGMLTRPLPYNPRAQAIPQSPRQTLPRGPASPAPRRAPQPALAPPPARGIPITGRTGGRGPPNTIAIDGPSAATASAASDGAVSSGPAGGPAGASSTATPSFGAAAGSSGSIFSRHDGRPIEDEYDPMRPNDYEEVMVARERARKAAEAEAERQAKLKEAEAEAERLRKQEEERARSAAAASGSGGGDGGGGGGVMSMEEYARRRAAMGMTGDDAFARRGGRGGGGPPGPPGMGGGGGGSMGPPGAGGGDDGASERRSAHQHAARRPLGRPFRMSVRGAARHGPDGHCRASSRPTSPRLLTSERPCPAPARPPASGYKGMTLAQKLLEKMGWREGEGLGKNRQGISNPLVAQKTNQRAGVIVEAPPVAPKQPLGGGAEVSEAKRLRGKGLAR
ncbi:DNA-damage-repair/toleration protein [Tetrabaena socialis]|uniref:DNA-damage-repair/toleration protein n=1 Tax=Tetrabaena socialis TaxID=47790 RepID=A0A2J8AEQ0_9CHLO|nr:DNA-damage-repair/toleration protein [Tetrabaena socialis]|eukprot:PNH10993.1 DNA-damage-repair/toleration protein [Tetrabaena socialis]